MKYITLLLSALLCFSVPIEANRLFTSGFEVNIEDSVEWHITTQPSTGAIDTGTVRTGDQSFRVTSPSTNTAKGRGARFTSGGTTNIDYYARVYIRCASFPNNTTTFLGFGTSSISDMVRVQLTSGGGLQARFDNDTAIAGSATLSTDTWYRIELRAKRHATPNAGNDEFEVKIDGTTDISTITGSSSNNWHTALVGINMYGTSDTATSADCYFDDVAINDSNGSSQNSFPGAGSVVTIFPNAAGDFNQTLTLAGSVPAATAWESSDDGTLTGASIDDTDYITFTDNATTWTGSGSRLAMGLDALPESAASIALVSTHVRVNTASATNASIVLSAQTANGGTKFTDSTTTTQNGTPWVLNQNSTSRSVSLLTMYLDPDGAAWTSGTVNSLQLLIRTPDANPDVNMTAAWATVEYEPTTTTTTGTTGGASGGQMLLLGVGAVILQGYRWREWRKKRKNTVQK